MSNTTTTSEKETRKNELERKRRNWQNAVNELYRSLELTPGYSASMEILNARAKDKTLLLTIKAIKDGERMIRFISEELKKLNPPSESKTQDQE
jgi:hypothetical protein